MVTKNNKINIYDVANYIIGKDSEITNLKLQKILFYVYTHYLVKTNGLEPMFDETIEAWHYWSCLS
ncbi:MAG: hypothetical protein ACQBVK_00755 [Candidatus Phytoplasma sp. TWB_XP]